MKQANALKIFKEWDGKGKYVFTQPELARLFPEDRPKAFQEGLRRLIKADLLKRACRGVYVNPFARCLGAYVIEEIAKTLRKGEYNYVSLESMLSEYGVISQIPMRLTVMTTGREGLYHTPYGGIEFTHTKRSVQNILTHVLSVPGRPLRIATKMTAWRDLKRVGRNTGMVQMEELNEDD